MKAVPVAVDQESHDKLIKAQTMKDQHGVAELIVSGKVLPVDDETKIQVIDSTLLMRQVRILEGAYTGR